MGQLASGAPHTVRMRRRTQQASTQRKLPRRPERAGRAARALGGRVTVYPLSALLAQRGSWDLARTTW